MVLAVFKIFLSGSIASLLIPEKTVDCGVDAVGAEFLHFAAFAEQAVSKIIFGIQCRMVDFAEENVDSFNLGRGVDAVFHRYFRHKAADFGQLAEIALNQKVFVDALGRVFCGKIIHRLCVSE